MDYYLYGDAKNAWYSGFGKLGFGLMRLPRKDENTIDVEETKKMVDHFMAAGMHYFDTAWPMMAPRTRFVRHWWNAIRATASFWSIN